jgi:UDP-N-acetylmuramyl-tripeptide synthetase
MTDEMLRAGMTHLVMEVSSHALHQHRTDGIDFAVGVFTNLSGDHLDYHATMEAYFAAKRRLFEGLGGAATAVLNRDDPWSEALAAATQAEPLWYGLSPAADLWARIDRIDTDGTRFRLVRGDEEAAAFTRLIGRHNVMNCLAAACACTALGVELAAVARALGEVARVAGRLERVRVEAPYDVFVDYAHTDDALENVLSALQPIKRGRLILAFGCGGDRDRTKRPRMARVAEGLADRIVVTSDNPRSERPEAIIEEIVAGFTRHGRGKTDVRPDRREAIELAVAQAKAGDLVLIAGKGHENYQDAGGRRVHFDDVEVAADAVRRREAAT